MTNATIRPAREADAPRIVEFVRALAAFENEPLEHVKITAEDVLRDAFGEPPRFEVLMADRDGASVGFALFFHTYSTWEGRPGLYIEDLYVEESERGSGAGLQLMAAVARLAEERGCGRVELSVLGWNPARKFYERLGMRHSEKWLAYRIVRPELSALAAKANPKS